jgi:hypothetical protein
MLAAIVGEMTALTEGDEISEPVVCRVVIAVGCREDMAPRGSPISNAADASGTSPSGPVISVPQQSPV